MTHGRSRQYDFIITTVIEDNIIIDPQLLYFRIFICFSVFHKEIRNKRGAASTADDGTTPGHILLFGFCPGSATQTGASAKKKTGTGMCEILKRREGIQNRAS